MENKHRFPYQWTLADANFTKDKGKVFSCFSCGGGSTMGYKLAGFDVIGCNEIDKRMMNIYLANHNPKYHYTEPIQTFKLREDLPDELYNLDILDGSPPCSSFSMCGLRDKTWGKMKKFREGQSEQILDELFFEYIELGSKLRPKIIVAENVESIMFASAIEYVKKIYSLLDNADYYCQHFLLNAANMGVPQNRKRVFFIALRKDIANKFLIRKDLFTIVPKLSINVYEELILFKEVEDRSGRDLNSKILRQIYDARLPGDKDMSNANIRLRGKRGNFNKSYAYSELVSPCLTTHEHCAINFNVPKYLGRSEVCKISTFPMDFNFLKSSPNYVCGMSVPPVMMAHIASAIHEQWLSKL